MNLTLHMAPDQPLLLPVFPDAPTPLCADQQRHPFASEEALCHALIERITQSHPVVIAEPVKIHELESWLEQAVQRGVARILLLPWNLHGATAQAVLLAMNTLYHSGAEVVSAPSLLLTPQVTVAGVSPVGPLGGFLPPQSRLDRLVEAWPGWKHVYTVLRSEHTAILILHSGKAHTLLPSSDRYACGKHQQLKQSMYASLCQESAEQGHMESVNALQRDSVIYAQYLADMVTAALDVLCSLPLLPQS